MSAFKDTLLRIGEHAYYQSDNKFSWLPEDDTEGGEGSGGLSFDHAMYSNKCYDIDYYAARGNNIPALFQCFPSTAMADVGGTHEVRGVVRVPTLV